MVVHEKQRKRKQLNSQLILKTFRTNPDASQSNHSNVNGTPTADKADKTDHRTDGTNRHLQALLYTAEAERLPQSLTGTRSKSTCRRDLPTDQISPDPASSTHPFQPRHASEATPRPPRLAASFTLSLSAPGLENPAANPYPYPDARGQSPARSRRRLHPAPFTVHEGPCCTLLQLEPKVNFSGTRPLRATSRPPD
ncbi:hypothetical protein ACRRTK_022586 [Alexandromys fortis]